MPGYRLRKRSCADLEALPDAIPTRFYDGPPAEQIDRQPGPRGVDRCAFRWTTQRGRRSVGDRTHACTYCVWGETPVLMADGRHKPMAELDVGDSIYVDRPRVEVPPLRG